MKNITTTTKTILFASLIAAMILPFSVMNFAEAKEDSIDKRNYFNEAALIFEENQELEKEVGIESEEISKLKEKSRNANASEKAAFDKDIQEREERKQAKENKIKKNKQTIDELEILNIKAKTVNPVKQQQYDAMQVAFYAKYIPNGQSTPNDANPAELVILDPQFKTFKVIVDPTEMEEFEITEDALIAEYTDFLKNMLGNNLKVVLEQGSTRDIACSARDASCDPVYGGLSVSNEDEIGTGHSTMGYKVKLGSTVGFVMTAHGAGGSNNDIVQPDDQNRVIGNVDAYQDDSDCDCAFVDINYPYSVDNKIYKNSSTSYNVTGEVADSSQTLYSWAYKSGAGTNVSLGQIVGNVSTLPHNTLEIYRGGGDSGAPIFDIDSGNDVDLYGMAFKAAGTQGDAYAYLQYFAYDHINTELGTSLP